MGPDNQMLEYKEIVKKVTSQIKGIKAKGIDTSLVEKKVETSTVFMMRDDIKKALELITEANNDVSNLKAQLESASKGQAAGKSKLGKGLGALLTDGGLKLADETDPNAAKERKKGQMVAVDVGPGSSFVIPEKKPQRCFELYAYLLSKGLTGVAFTTEEPKSIVKDYKIGAKESFVWVTDEVSADFNTLPKDLEKINEYYLERLQKTMPGVVLIQGLDVLNKDAAGLPDVMDSFQTFQRTMKDIGGVLLVNIHTSTLKENEPALKGSFSILDLPNSMQLDEALRIDIGAFKKMATAPASGQADAGKKTPVQQDKQVEQASGSKPPASPSAPAPAPDPNKAAKQQALRNARLEEIGLFIQDWKSDGFDTSTFEKDLDKELPVIEESFIQFSDKISKLKDLLDQIDDFKRKRKPEIGLIKAQIDSLEATMHDPERISEAESGLAQLSLALEQQKKKRVEETVNKRREEIKARLEEWTGQGFELKDLQEALEKQPEALEQAYQLAEGQVKGAEAMLAELSALEAGDSVAGRLLKTHFESIRSGIRDPRNAKAKRSSIDAMKAFLESNSVHLHTVDERLARHQQKNRDMSGYLEQLKQPIASISMQSMLRSLDTYESQMNRREEMENYVQDLPRLTANFKDDPEVARLASEVAQLQRNLPAADSISPMYSRFLSLKVAINEQMKKRELQLKAEQDLRDQLVAKYKADIAQWQGEGYIVNSLREALDQGGSLDSLERIHSDLKQRIDELKVQNGLLSKLLTPENLVDFKDEISGIKKDIVDPSRSQDVIQRILKLQYSVKQKEKGRSERKIEDERRSYIRKMLDGYRREGYQVSQLDSKLSGPLPALEQAFEDLRGRVSKVEAVKADLSRLDLRGLDAMSAPLLSIISDPYQVDKMEPLLKKLKDTVASNSLRREEIKRAVKSWKDMGLDTSGIDSAMGNDLPTLEKRFNDLGQRIERLLALKKEIDSLNTAGFERKVKVIQNKMSNPENLESVLEDVAYLKAEIEKGRSQQSAASTQKKEELLKIATQWQGMGYNVSEVLEGLQAPTGGLSLEDASALVEMYRTKVDKAERIRSDLTAMDDPDLHEDIGLLLDNITNLDILEELEDSYTEIKRRATQKASDFGKYAARIEKVRSQGYVVTRLESLRGKSQEEIEQGFVMFENDVKLLGDLKDALEGLKEMPHPPEYDDVFSDLYIKLADPDRIAEIGQNISELEEHLRAYAEAAAQAQARPATPEAPVQARPSPAQTAAPAPASMNSEELSRQINDLVRSTPGAQAAAAAPSEVGSEEEGGTGAEPKKKLKVAKKPVPVRPQPASPAAPKPAPAGPKPVPVSRAPEAPRPQPVPVVGAKPEAPMQKPKPVPVQKTPEGSKPKPVPVSKGPVPAQAGGDKQARIKQMKEEAKTASKNKDFKKAVELYNQIQSLDPADKEAEFLKKRAITLLKSSGGDKAAALPAAAAPVSPAAQPASGGKSPGAASQEQSEQKGAAAAPQSQAVNAGKAASCTSCGGTGKCYWCSGSGKCDSCGGSGKNIVGAECISCKGNGKCQNCDGSGLCYWCQK